MRHTTGAPVGAEHSRATGQQGSVVVIVAAFLLILGALLMSIQVGYNYFEQQRLQKAADLAALSAVQGLSMKHCDLAALQVLVRKVVDRNGLPDAQVQAVECGRWAGSPTPTLHVGTSGTDAAPLNAVRVRLGSQTVSFLPRLFGAVWAADPGTGPVGGANLHAQSVAVVGPPVATFTVGARLLHLSDDGLVAPLLGALGLTPSDITVLDAAGLANAHITPSGILQALDLPPTVLAGVGTPDQLARIDALTLGELLDIYGQVLDRSASASLQAGALQSLVSQIDVGVLNLPVRLLGEGGVLTQVSTANLSSALSTDINLLDLVGTSILVANGKNLANLTLSVPGLASVQAYVVAPPTLVTATVQDFQKTPPLVAHNTQMQLKLKLDPLKDVPLVSGLVSVSVPLTVGVANSEAKLTAIDFDGQSADFSARSTMTNLCIGVLPADGPCLQTSTPDYAKFVDIKLLLLPLVTVSVRARIPLVAADDWTSPATTIPVHHTATLPTNTKGGPRTLTASDLDIKVSLLGILPLPLGQILSPLVTALNGILTPLLQGLVLPLVAGESGETDIHLISITRGSPYLVQ